MLREQHSAYTKAKPDGETPAGGGGKLPSAIFLAITAPTLGACALPNPVPLPPHRDARAVQVGGESDWDACWGVGALVVGQDDLRTVKVRIRPDRNAAATGSLGPGDYFWVCDSAAEGEWTGILFSHRADNRIDCGVSGTIATRRDYDGPCRQGWVPTKAITVVAG